MTRSIASELQALAKDESKATAIATAEVWRNVLEEMAEVASQDEAEAVAKLIASVDAFLIPSF